MKQTVAALVLSIFIMDAGYVRAGDYSENPERSFFIGFDLGAGLNPGVDMRSPADLYGEEGAFPEAYSLAAFLFGVSGGYRFNEIIALELGWHEQQHNAHEEWGGVAYYHVAHLAARLAIPNPTRLTPVFKVGPAFVGGFSYGAASYGAFEENSTYIVGGFAGMTLEYELMLGVVGIFSVSYLPVYRFGMDGVLKLHYEYDEVREVVDEVGDTHLTTVQTTELIDEKDFSKGDLVHLIWISAGFQFEWTFR